MEVWMDGLMGGWMGRYGESKKLIVARQKTAWTLVVWTWQER
jgi:hypothetical protein